MRTICRLALLATLFASYAGPAAGQSVIDSPPTVIPFQSSYSIGSGSTLNAYEGAQIFARLNITGGTLNLLGAELDQGADANSGAMVNIDDGNIAGLYSFSMGNGSTTTIRGGRFSHTIEKQAGATLIIEGVDFALNGVPVPGLASPGDEATVAVPDGTLFTGILTNGAPFTFENLVAAGDDFEGDIVLRQTARPSGPAVVNVPADTMPPGVLPGQTLNVHAGAALLDAMNAGPGSVVNLEGGDAPFLKFYGAEINVNSGTAHTLQGYGGSTVRLNGGDTFQLSVGDGATVLISDGRLGTLAVFPDSDIHIDGGVVERLKLFRSGSEAVMRGGTIEQQVSFVSGATLHLLGGKIATSLAVSPGAHVIMEGGMVGMGEYAPISTAIDAELTLVGRAFTLDGQPIPGLTAPGDSIIFMDRPDQILSAILADGTPLNLYVGTEVFPQGSTIGPRISPQSTLRLILVPEPGTLLLALTAIMAGSFRRLSSPGR